MKRADSEHSHPFVDLYSPAFLPLSIHQRLSDVVRLQIESRCADGKAVHEGRPASRAGFHISGNKFGPDRVKIASVLL